MGGGVPKVDTLSEKSALEMIAEREGVEVEKKVLIGGFGRGQKRKVEVADLGEVERRAARLRCATTAAGGDGGVEPSASAGGDDEIDIDGNEEKKEQAPQPPPSSSSSVIGVSEKAIPVAVFGALTASGNIDT